MILGFEKGKAYSVFNVGGWRKAQPGNEASE
jgi:hypothetical protein